MLKVKEIMSGDMVIDEPESLDTQVNSFLKELHQKGYPVIDIKYQVFMDGSDVTHCVLVIYSTDKYQVIPAKYQRQYKNDKQKRIHNLVISSLSLYGILG